MPRTAPILAAVLLTGCASHTAQIAASANDARAQADDVRAHLVEAIAGLDRIEQAAASIHEQIGYVQDSEPAFITALKYGSLIAIAAAAVGIVYLIRTKI